MKKGAWAVLLSYVLWGVFPIYWKLLADVDSVYVLCCRIVFSLVVSLIVVPACGKWGEAMRVLRDRRLRRRMLACGLFISFNWGAFIYCVASNRVLDASRAYYINPILAILMGFVVFRERLTAAQWTAVALAAAGVAAPMVMEGQFPLLAVLIGLSFYTLNEGYNTDRFAQLEETLNNPLAYCLNLEYNVNALTVLMDTVRGTPDTIESGDWVESDYLADDGISFDYRNKAGFSEAKLRVAFTEGCPALTAETLNDRFGKLWFELEANPTFRERR